MRMLWSCVLIVGWVSVASADQARQILDATGVQGGLVVHLGCGDGKLTAALRAGESFLVHGLDADGENIERARRHIRSLGLCGKVSVDRWAGGRLPYIDGIVRLVVAEQMASMDEVIRVLAPGGVAYVNHDGRWTKTVKPWPDEIDEWSHYLHDASGNAVARDTRVGPPRHMQWLAEPVWTRNHHTLASISAVVSAGGRIFYILDEGPAASLKVPSKWVVVARDAFSGVLLWKRAIPTWAWHMKGFRSGPVQLPRTLVAAADRVYLPLGISAPVSALDAATGKVVRTFEGTRAAEELILDDGTLLVVTGSPTAEQAMIGPKRSPDVRFPNEKSIVAVDAATGQQSWKWTEPQPGRLIPLTLAAADGRVLLADGRDLVCLDRGSGKELWRWQSATGGSTTEKRKPDQAKKPGRKQRPGTGRGVGWSVATLAIHDGVVLWAAGGRLRALSATDGTALWECPCKPGFRSPVDVFATGGLVWLGPDFAEGRDLRSGEVKKTNTAAADVWTVGHHHRCYREKATERYILTGKRGIEFLDLAGENHTRNNFVRGVCQYGIMPGNGLIYAPSHACGCFMEAKLFGFWALAAAKESRVEGRESRAGSAARLVRGEAFGKSDVDDSSFIIHPSSPWPMHRHDPLRSGATDVELPARLEDVWSTGIGGRLSAPVVAEGTVVVASVDAHRVTALDALRGDVRWSFTAGGRVDSPPTVYRGQVLFGCADGRVYCLRLADGKLAWRFRAAPEDLRTVSLGQVESVWPVHGSVLVQDGVAYVTAGRSSYLDGGIFLYGLDPATGKVLYHTRVRTAHPKVDKAAEDRIERQQIVQNATDYKTFTAPDRSDAFAMGGAINDILVGDGSAVYLRQLKFDRECTRQPKPGRHLLSTSRLLDGVEVHRSHFVLGTGDFNRIPVAYSWIVYNPDRHGSRLNVPYGLMLSFDERSVWSVRRKGGGYLLVAEANRPFSPDEEPLPDFRLSQQASRPKLKWSVQIPLRPRAMVRCGKVVVLGGMPGMGDPPDPLSPGKNEAAYEGRKGGLLRTVSAADGTELAQRPLPSPPVWDGMAAADRRLYLSTSDGKVLCLGSR